jgi:hypothetical protein
VAFRPKSFLIFRRIWKPVIRADIEVPTINECTNVPAGHCCEHVSKFMQQGHRIVIPDLNAPW